MHSRWELGSFASGGISSKPPGYQFILWDTNAKINGLVATESGDARITSALRIPLQHRLCGRAFRDDYCHGP